MSYDFLWQIALILVSTKVCGLITRRFQMPLLCLVCCPATVK